MTEGSLVPVARPGTWLPPTKDKPSPYKIRRRRYRGEISEGMLCSCAELGWDSSATDRVALLDASAGLRADTGSCTTRKQILMTLTTLIEHGKVAPVISRKYSFGDIQEAVTYQEQGHVPGEVVVTVGAEA